jgi:hypothetical protein
MVVKKGLLAEWTVIQARPKSQSHSVMAWTGPSVSSWLGAVLGWPGAGAQLLFTGGGGEEGPW